LKNNSKIAVAIFIIILSVCIFYLIEVNGVGTQGIQGIQGIAGINGISFNVTSPYVFLFNGTNGLQGIQGIQGVKGDIGLTGSSGLTSVTYPLVNSSLGVLSLTQSALSITHSQISDWGTVTSGFLTSNYIGSVSSNFKVSSSELYLNSLSLTHSNFTGQFLANQIPNLSITHSNITDWSTATSGFLTSNYISSVSGSGLSVSGGGQLTCSDVNQAVLTSSQPTFDSSSSPSGNGLYLGGTTSSTSFTALTIGSAGNIVINNNNVNGELIETVADGAYIEMVSTGDNFILQSASFQSSKFEFSSGYFGLCLTINDVGNVYSYGTIQAVNGVISDYISGAYGATWTIVPTFPTATNGMIVVVYNTSTGATPLARIYCYVGSAWHYDAGLT
jgi:hypothetical protein